VTRRGHGEDSEDDSVECKHWDKPVDSRTMGYFMNILVGRN